MLFVNFINVLIPIIIGFVASLPFLFSGNETAIVIVSPLIFISGLISSIIIFKRARRSENTLSQKSNGEK